MLDGSKDNITDDAQVPRGKRRQPAGPRCVPVTISVPRSLLIEIDKKCAKGKRSRFLGRMIRRGMETA